MSSEQAEADVEAQADAAVDLLRRLSPGNVSEHLQTIIDVNSDLTEELLARVDQPLRVARDAQANGREYLLCDYNRDGDSFRSPWSNTYDPPLEDGAVPSDSLRTLEVQFNDVFDAYRQQYYEGGLSSAYLWDTEDGGFAGCFLIKKIAKAGAGAEVQGGSWDVIHVLESSKGVEAAPGTAVHYKLTTTVLLSLRPTLSAASATLSLCGNLTKQTEATVPLAAGGKGHIIAMGKLMEEMEGRIRDAMQQVYFGKTNEVVSDLRDHGDVVNRGTALQGGLAEEFVKQANDKLRSGGAAE
ncbi:hypothetical protein PPROV_000571500 [Pycnococcus provasolii]|uniref:F-actin-capping protein subunit beta n=1 Tax=Pycnococcus provasolii TaxID=41880 RepID=A0A830HN67_9CHLO|nr:hypothetical protein PPROV_000571500 [Pycnococcus provasolii]